MVVCLHASIYACLPPPFHTLLNFNHNEDINSTNEGLQMLGAHEHWAASSSLVCYNYCDTGDSFSRSSSRNRDIHICCYQSNSETVTNSFNDSNLSQPGFEHPTFQMLPPLSAPLLRFFKNVGAISQSDRFSSVISGRCFNILWNTIIL